MQRGTLSFRITVLLVGGFVLLQFVVFALTSQATGDRRGGGLGLPDAAQMRAMVDVIEAMPPQRRAAAARAFDGALYHAAIEEGPLPPSAESAQGMEIGRFYSLGLPDHRLSVTGRVARFPTIARLNPWPGRLSDPLAIHVALAGTSPTMLTIVSQPSEPVQVLLRQRAAFLGIGGILALIALAVAVRATTRPLMRLARDIRTYRGEPDSPDLAVAGSPELRDLAQAYNGMKGRIAELMAERTRILAAIAHDLRTYITRLRLRAEYIDDPAQRKRAAADLDEMAALLDDTLLLARAEARKADERRPLDLVTELSRMVEIRRELGDPVDLPACAVERARVVASPLAIRRVLANLIDNALRHAGHVRLTLHADEGWWRIDVDDDGPGVPPEKLGALGQPFGRVDPSRDRSAGGAGLGLAIVRALVTAQDGEVSFANRREGGFLVSVRLPMA